MDEINRRSALRELITVSVIIALTTVVFWLTDVDIAISKLFYNPSAADNPWDQQNFWLWKFFYFSVPVLSAILMVGPLGVLIGALFKEKLKALRIPAIFVFLTVALGPGLVVNIIFKDHWGRPRPRQVVELGGKYNYLPVLKKGVAAQGKSFPCGHASVGFAFYAFWFLWRRRRPQWAWAALVGASVLGGLMGVGRIAAGGHFFSDVIWAALFTFMAAWLTYYFILKVPERERAGGANVLGSEVALAANPQAGETPASASDGASALHGVGPTSETAGNDGDRGTVTQKTAFGAKTSSKILQICIYTVLSLVVVTVVSLATPFYKELDYKLPNWTKDQPLEFQAQIQRADVQLILEEKSDFVIHVEGDMRGFGFPTNEAFQNVEVVDNVVVYKLFHKGFFTELESYLKIKMVVAPFSKITLRLDQGDIDIVRKTSPKSTLQLDVTTQKGKVTGL